jgi:hypothetical protein
VPGESLAYHGERNHFSNWFKARTEFALADRLRPRKVSDFATVEDLRQELLRAIREYRRDTSRGAVVDFDSAAFDRDTAFSRIGGGSLGGKARGLAFVDTLLLQSGIGQRFPGIDITVPQAVVLATDLFDEFLERNGLRDVGLESADEHDIERRFVAADLPAAAERDLSSFVSATPYPLAVRSSSLLEDSQYQPFAGIYATYMLPNDHEREDVRLRQLLTAIKRVYASTFSRAAKRYLDETPYRLEEEKMAVVLQRVVGGRHGQRFYPDLAGVARSHNFYPLPPMRQEDGPRRRRARARRNRRHRRRLLSLLSPLSASHRAVFVRAGHAGQRAARLFRARARPRQLDAVCAGAVRSRSRRGRRARWPRSAPRSLRERRRLRRHLTAGVRLVTFAPMLKHGSSRSRSLSTPCCRCA